MEVRSEVNSELRSTVTSAYSAKPSVLYSLSQPVASTVAEPNTTRRVRKPLQGNQRKAFRTLRSLRNDIKLRHPQQVLPSAWLLRAIVCSHFEDAGEYSWNITMFHLLKHLHQNTQNLHAFIDPQSQTSLFPTQEGFTREHFRTFTHLCLELLESQSYQYL